MIARRTKSRIFTVALLAAASIIIANPAQGSSAIDHDPKGTSSEDGPPPDEPSLELRTALHTAGDALKAIGTGQDQDAYAGLDGDAYTQHFHIYRVGNKPTDKSLLESYMTTATQHSATIDFVDAIVSDAVWTRFKKIDLPRSDAALEAAGVSVLSADRPMGEPITINYQSSSSKKTTDELAQLFPGIDSSLLKFRAGEPVKGLSRQADSVPFYGGARIQGTTKAGNLVEECTSNFTAKSTVNNACYELTAWHCLNIPNDPRAWTQWDGAAGTYIGAHSRGTRFRT